MSIVLPQSFRKASASVLWNGDFETGNLSQWANIHQGGSWGNSTIQIVTSPVRQGKFAAKFTVIPNGQTNGRAQLDITQQMTGGYPGQDWYYYFSIYIPSNPMKTSGWQPALIAQWMDLQHSCSPPNAVRIQPGNPPHFLFSHIYLDNNNGCKSLTTLSEHNAGPFNYNIVHDLGPFQYDKWYDFTLHFKWSADATVGFNEIWINGANVLSLIHERTLDNPTGGVYMTQSLYHPGNNGTSVLYFDCAHRSDVLEIDPCGAGITTTPTLLLSNSPSPVPSLLPTGSPVPSDTPTPQPAVLSLTVGLDGIGVAGDAAHPLGGG
ncbi:MAG TPA: polysaccharide lyase, partial [Patescibacteria group bacterium]|nr:polysaccharide lyase [Patescibacteria group bacterium]